MWYTWRYAWPVLLPIAACSTAPAPAYYGGPAYAPPPASLPGGPVRLPPPVPLGPGPVLAAPPLAAPAMPGAGDEGLASVPPPAPVEMAPLAGPVAPGSVPAPSPADVPAPAEAASASPPQDQSLTQRLDALRASLAQDRGQPAAAPAPVKPGRYGGLSSAGDVAPARP